MRAFEFSSKHQMKKIVLDNYTNKIVEKFSKSKENSNLYFYSQLKCTINTEEYLKTEKKFQNRQLSRTTCRLRTSDHCLLIDTGRHKKVPQQQRLCKICNDIDDEFHFFLQCNSNVQP